MLYFDWKTILLRVFTNTYHNFFWHLILWMCHFLSMQNDSLSPTLVVGLTGSIFFLSRLPPSGVQAGSQLRCVYMLCLIEVWGLYFFHKSRVLLIGHIIEQEATSFCHPRKFRHIGIYSLWFYHALGLKIFFMCR